MGLESATYINQLVDTNPVPTDSLGDVYKHLRLIKSVLQNTFPALTGAVTMTQADLNEVANNTDDIADLQTDLTMAEVDIAALEAAAPIVGHIREDGTVVGGTAAWAAQGTPVVRNSTGNYTINFPTTADNAWVVTTQRSVQNDSSIICQSEVTASTTTSVTVNFEEITGGGEGNQEDCEFHFMAFPY
jgi:stress response protein SCP2